MIPLALPVSSARIALLVAQHLQRAHARGAPGDQGGDQHGDDIDEGNQANCGRRAGAEREGGEPVSLARGVESTAAPCAHR